MIDNKQSDFSVGVIVSLPWQWETISQGVLTISQGVLMDVT